MNNETQQDKPAYMTDEYKAYVNELPALMKPYIDAGLQLTLTKRDGKDFKAPFMTGYTDETKPNFTYADYKSWAQWATNKGIELTGFGVVNGLKSKHRMVLDFDMGEYLPAIRDKVLEVTGFDLNTLPRVRSGRTTGVGYHLILRSTASRGFGPLACKLVSEGKYKAIVETCIQNVAPGCKHQSGNRYILEHGDPVNPPVLELELLDKILNTVRTFDEAPPKKPFAPRERKLTDRPAQEGESVIDVFKSRNSIYDVLERFGYTRTGEDTYKHPNDGETEHSVHILSDDYAYFWSGNDPMGGRIGATSFGVYCKLAHGDNCPSAVKALAAEYGMQRSRQSDSYEWPSNALVMLPTVPPASPASPEQSGTAPDPLTISSDLELDDWLKIDLAQFPVLLGQTIAALSQENPSFPTSCNLLSCFAIPGVLIGKQAVTMNHGQKYYPNLWTVIVCPTNQNKSGSKNLVHAALQDPQFRILSNKPTFASLYSELGRTVPKKQWEKMSAIEKASEKNEIAITCKRDRRGLVFIPDECTGTLKRLMGAWNAKAPANDLEDVLSLMDPANPFESSTSGEGFKAMYDLCISFIGYTQDATWQSEMASTHLKDVGLFGRFVPNPANLKIINLPAPKTSLAGIVKEIRGLSSLLEFQEKICTFGVDTALKLDPIREDIDKLTSSPLGQRFQKRFPSDWGRLTGKVIGHAIKLSMICEFLETGLDRGGDWVTDDRPVDCRKWFYRCAELVLKCYLSYLDSADDCRQLDTRETKILEQLARHQYLTGRDLQRSSQLYGQAFTQLVQSMIDSALIGVLKRKDGEPYKEALKLSGKNYNTIADLFYRIQ